MQVELVTGREDLHESLRAALAGEDALVWHRTPGDFLRSGSNLGQGVPPSVIFVDWTNGGGESSDFRQFRRPFPGDSARVFAVLDDPARRAEALAAGADACLLIPFATAEVQGLLRSGASSNSGPVNLIGELVREAVASADSGWGAFIRVIEVLGGLVGADAAWALIQEQDGREPVALRAYPVEPPAECEEDSENLPKRILGECRASPAAAPRIIHLDGGNRGSFDERTVEVVAIPLHTARRFLGVVFLEHGSRSLLSGWDEQGLAALGGCLSVIGGAEVARVQAETQAIRSGLVGLVARMLGQEEDPDQVLARALEHTVPVMEGLTGGVWLLAPDKESLHLASSMSLSPYQTLPHQVQQGRGLVGSVASQGRAIHTDNPSEHPSFDPTQDRGLASVQGSFLAVPLRADREVMGVLAIGTAHRGDIGDHERVFIESVADIAGSRLSRMRLADELRGQLRQQGALCAMGREIACGLDLGGTLERALQWLNRLVEVEAGFLWLADEQAQTLELSAVHGVNADVRGGTSLFLDESLLGKAAFDGQATILDLTTASPRLVFVIRQLLACAPRDLAVVPLHYRGELIGIIAMVNKVGAGFTARDRALLSAAGDLIAVAVGNARLHAETVSLAKERERAHVAALRATRLATVGRLAASLSHEINNPMQTIRGALALALEDLEDEEAVRNYMRMSMDGVDRVVQLVGRLRQIYRSSEEGARPVDVNDAVRMACTYAEATSSRQGVPLDCDLESGLPQVIGVFDQVHLVLLSLMLCLTDAVGAAGGGTLQVRTAFRDEMVRVEFATSAPVALLKDVLEGEREECLTEVGVRLAFSRDIIQAMDGQMRLEREGEAQTLTVEFPVSRGSPGRGTHARR